MNIMFLGTSHGSAEQERACSSTLIELSGHKGYLIDAGLEVDYSLKKNGRDACCFKDIFLTHIHEDHAGGLSSALKSFNVWSPIDGYETVGDIRIHFPDKESSNTFEGWYRMMSPELPQKFDGFRVVKEGMFFDDGIMKVTAIKTDHVEGMNSYAYILEAEGKRIGFTGDLSHDLHDFPEEFKEGIFDLLVCEMTHFPPEAIVPILKKCNATQIIFNHVRSRQKIDEYKKYFNEFEVEPIVSYDGFEYEV